MNSERKVASKNLAPRPNFSELGEGSMARRKLTKRRTTWRGVSDSTMARAHSATGEALLVPGRNSKLIFNRGRTDTDRSGLLRKRCSKCLLTSTCNAFESITGITQSVLLRGAAQLTKHSSRFLAERSADFVAETTPHNRDRLSGPKYADRTKSHAVSRWQRETAAAPSAEKGESIIPINSYMC
jgi:hypothetical protein